MPFDFIETQTSSLKTTSINTITVAIYKRKAFRVGKGWSKEDFILLLQRAENPYKISGYRDRFAFFWELLGGEVDPQDESIEAALEREVGEEAKLRLKSFKLYGYSPFLSKGKAATNWVFAGTVGLISWVRRSKEHVDHKWVTIEEALQTNLAAKHNEILRKICTTEGDEELVDFIKNL